MSESITLPLTPAQIITRLQALEQNQIATAAALSARMTGPVGIRIMSAVSAAEVLQALPRLPQRRPLAY